MKERDQEHQFLAINRTAFHDYLILEKYEAGIVLSGCEVKSIREGKVSLRDSFARVIGQELFLFNCHISAYKQGNRFNLDPTRDRKLLMHRHELRKMISKVNEKGMTLVPLNMYLVRNKVKVRIALAKAKKLFDKREDLKKKAIEQDLRVQTKAQGHY